MMKIKINSGLIFLKPCFIAGFLDYKNQEKEINKINPRQHFEYKYLDPYIRSFGEIKILKAYGPFNYYKIAGNQLKDYGFEINNSIKKPNNKGKDKTDPMMITDIVDTYHKYPEINLIFVISGDSDFIEPILKVKENPDNRVFVISDKNSLSKDFKDIVDFVITYQELKYRFELKHKRW